MSKFRPVSQISVPMTRPMWLFAAALACGAGSVSEAQAGCAPGSGGPQDYVCSGATPATSIANPASVAFVGGKATGAITFTYAGGGDANFSMDGASSITAAGTALTMVTTAGHVDMTTPAGSNINGPITSTAGIAILAGAAGAGNNVNIVTGAGGIIKGATGGIVATADTTGEVDFAIGDKVTATAGPALKATAVDGAINITSTAALSGGTNGILASTTGNGLITVNAIDTVTSTLGTAISLMGAGTGDLTVVASSAVTSAATATSISAIGLTGNVTITTYDTVTGGAGILAATGGAGAANVTAASAVTAAVGDGISASSVDGAAIVQAGDSVTAGFNGIVANANGKGSATIATHGDVLGTNNVGVWAQTDSGAIQIDMDKGTFVSGGAAGLRVKTNTGAATINNGATVVGLAGADAVQIDANLGAATLNNAGNIVSTGNAINVQSGAVLVRNAGTIDGVITSGAASVSTLNNNGVWLNAAGSTLGFLNNNGAITLGPAAGTPDMITVTGDAAFGAKSVLNMRFTPTAMDTIVVGGQTTIAGGIVNLTGSAAGLTKGMVFTLLSSAGGVTGNFSAVSSNLGSFAGALSNDGTNIFVTLLTRDFTSLALNRNQLAVANAVFYGSSTLATGPGSRLLTALNNAPDAAIPAALTQMSGDGVVTGAANAALQAGHLFTSALADQSDIFQAGGVRDINSITLTEPFAYAPTRVDGSKWPVSRQRYAPPPPRQAFVQRTWRVWASGFGGQTKLSGDTGTGSTSQTVGAVGGAMGVDYQLGQSTLIGAAVGYSSSAYTASATNVSGATSGLHVGAYSSMKIGAFYTNVSLAYSGYSNTSKRTISSIGGAAAESQSGNFSSEEVRTRIEVGRKMTMEAMAITPFAAIEVASVHTHGFSEYGIAADGQAGMYGLAYAGKSTSSVPTYIGLKLESRIDTGPVVLTPWISIAWRHEWSTSRSQNATLLALPSPFTTIGASAASDALQLKAGAQVQLTRTAALYATFEGELLTKNPVYAGKGGVRIGW